MAASGGLRSVWNGNLRFGLLSIPVGLAVTRQREEVSFRLLHRECSTPIQLKRWCPTHEREVAGDELVKGFEVAKGQFVTVEDAELDALTLDDTRTIDVLGTIDAEQLDPLAFETAYYLTASESPIGRRPYVLMQRALAATGKLALARMIYRGNEWLVTVSPLPAGRGLLLHKIAFTGELVDPGPLDQQLAGVDVSDQEAELARELVWRLWKRKLKPADLAARKTQLVRQLVDAKLAGQPLVQAPAQRANGQQPPPADATVDLLPALRASLRGRRVPRQAEPQPRPGRAAVKR